MLRRDSGVACVGPEHLVDREEYVPTVEPVSLPITEIKLANNCITSGTAASYCGWFPHARIFLPSLQLTAYRDRCCPGLTCCPLALHYQ